MDKAMLRKFLNDCNLEYRENGTSPITDDTYDYLLNQGIEIYGDIFKLGLGVKGNKKHLFKLLSLNKYYNIDSIKKFIKTNKVMVLPKVDVITLSLTYDNGRLISARTRGDGVSGNELIYKIKEYINLPKIDRTCYITGEVYIDKN